MPPRREATAATAITPVVDVAHASCMLLAAGFSGKGRDIPRAIPVFADSIGMENRAIAAMARRQRLTAITVGEKAIRGKPNNAR